MEEIMAKIKYVVELAIDATWIADGFDIRSNKDVKDLLQQLLPYAYDHEVSGRVISKPKLSIIKKLQGYTT
jgi:hypothetical protein